jgi:hypothetical protein
MPTIALELRQGAAYGKMLGVVRDAMDVHHRQEGCTFARTPEEVTDEVFEFMVSKVEGAEADCPLHAGQVTTGFGKPGGSVSGFN